MRQRDESANSVKAQARSLIAVGRHADAIALLHSAISSEPNDPDLHCWLGFALLGANRPAEALRAAQSAAALAPEYEWPHRLMAYALIRLRKEKQGLASAQQALRLNPTNPAVLSVTAEAQLAWGSTADADATAARLIQLEPGSAGGFDLRGRAALKEKRFVEAEAYFREALRLAPDNWAFNNNLGVALQGQKRRKEAVEAFERSVKANPRVNLARRNLFSATQAYVGAGGVIAFFLLLHVLPDVGRAAHLPDGLVVFVFFGGLVAAIVGFWLVGIRRRRQLSPAVDRFYRRELGRDLNIQLLHGLYKVGLPLAIVVGLFALALAQSPGFPLWIVAGALLILVWIVASPHLWRQAVLPRLRPGDIDGA